MADTIIIERITHGHHVRGVAEYIEEEDGWQCRVKERNGPYVEVRSVKQSGNDAYATLIDMVDLALVFLRSRPAA